MDQASAPKMHEIDDIRATGLLKATASVNRRGERMEPLRVNQTAAEINTGWECLPCGKTFREWAEVERHLRETITPTGPGSSGAGDNAPPQGVVALAHTETPVEDDTSRAG